MTEEQRSANEAAAKCRKCGVYTEGMDEAMVTPEGDCVDCDATEAAIRDAVEAGSR